MFKDIIIGQYVPGNSPLHKMNPPVKIIMTILYIVLLFILKNPISYVVFTIYTITLILISGVPFKMILKGLKPMLWIFIFTAVLNVFMTPGDTVWALKIFKFTLKITKEGIESGSLMVIRLLYLVMGTSLLTLTTSPLQLTDGIEKLLKPFNKKSLLLLDQIQNNALYYPTVLGFTKYYKINYKTAKRIKKKIKKNLTSENLKRKPYKVS